MNNFKSALEKKIIESIPNNFGADNFDEHRYGKYLQQKTSITQKAKNIVKKAINRSQYNVPEILESIKEYYPNLEFLWEKTNNESRELIVSIIAYRLLGYKKVKLPVNNKQYWEAIETAKSLADAGDTYDPHFMHFILQKFNLHSIGYDIKLYFSSLGIAIDYLIEQYAFKSGDKKIVAVEPGDVVLDAGACWGDTALYFAHQAGEQGKVYSFEFIPGNIKLFKINTSLNLHLEKRIALIQHPVSNKTGDTIYFKDLGPGSKVEFQPFKEQTGTVTTVSIDNFIAANNINKVDFIKIDIEGAEPLALEGAIETIKKFRPKLAVAIYHSMDDFANIPKWILDLNLNYELFIGHYTIHAEETICFAKPKL